MNKRYASVTILLCLLVVLCCAAVFCACKTTQEVVIEVHGDCYRGALVEVSANLKGFEEGASAEFYIAEEYDWVFFSGNKLAFSYLAVPGAKVTICVKVGDVVAEKVITVQNTPVTELEITSPAKVKAGERATLSCSFTPSYATDVQPQYVITEGADIATISGNELIVSDSANYTDTISVRARVGEVISEEKVIVVSTIQPESIRIVALSSTLKRGEETRLSVAVTPSTCTLGAAELKVPESEYYTYENGVLYVRSNAPVTDVEITARLGSLTDSFVLHIVKTPVEVVQVDADHGAELLYGDVVTLYPMVNPLLANDSEVTYTVAKGEDLIRFESKNTFKVIKEEVGGEIVLVAEADGVRYVKNFVIVSIPVESVTLTAEDVTATVGDERAMRLSVFPENAIPRNTAWEITKGGEYATLQNGVIRFVGIGDGLTEVVVRVDCDGHTAELTFYVTPVRVESVQIFAEREVNALNGGETVSFRSVVEPANATYSTLTYYVKEQGSYGSFDGNVFTVGTNPPRDVISVYAVSADGVKSNYVELSIEGTVQVVTPSSWDWLDNNAARFNGLTNVRLDLSALPRNADLTTVVISDDVQYLEIIGGYQGESTLIKDLFFYFLTTDSVTVKLYSLGVTIASGFGGDVLDFGNLAQVTLEYEGENYICAGNPYMAYTVGYTVDGAINGGSDDYIRKHGMDGFGGHSGGNAVNGKKVLITGQGSLTLLGGNGANGTAGGNGVEGSGRGGNGGFGGDGGYAVFADELILDVQGLLTLQRGNAGRGGVGGSGVRAGANGADGEAGTPYFANTSFTNNTPQTVTLREGGLAQSNQTRSVPYTEYVRLLERYYKIDIHYGNDYTNPYTKYKMTAQLLESKILSLLYALDYALAVFPKNMYYELQHVNAGVNIYLMNTITRNGSSIYGLTSSSNKVWFATFDTRLRGVFYSTHYNIMIHELFHVLTFSMGELDNNPMKKGLPDYNLKFGYTTNTAGVYNPEGTGYKASNSAFLTSYSKSNFNEDISDNMSLVCMQVQAADFLEGGMPLARKVAYISQEYEKFYSSLTSYTKVLWKKFLGVQGAE